MLSEACNYVSPCNYASGPIFFMYIIVMGLQCTVVVLYPAGPTSRVQVQEPCVEDLCVGDWGGHAAGQTYPPATLTSAHSFTLTASCQYTK